jgi:ribonuclease J
LPQVCLTVHRATNAIGGNCIEVSTSDGSRLILDVGRPLDAPRDATGLLPASLDLEASVDGVLVSHPHQDHYGLLDEVPSHWPVYCGEATAKLMRITSGIFGKPIERDFRYWKSRLACTVGAFTITPFLTDHSAFDAHMLLIEVAGKRIFYSGDFRAHGRKGALVNCLMNSPPADIDVLLMEGTNLGSNKPCMTEADLEDDFVDLFKKTVGRVFVSWSAQNIDRTVTLYRACLKAGRTLVVDLYTADVLDVLSQHGKLPRAGWPNLKVVITRNFARMYRMKGREEFVNRMAQHGVSARTLAETPEKWVAMIRPSLISNYQDSGVMPSADDAWSWSMWRGYLTEDEGVRLKAWFDEGGARAEHLHTSGHASPATLRAFAASIKARTMVPIHGVAWDVEAEGFPHISRLVDGQPMVI